MYFSLEPEKSSPFRPPRLDRKPLSNDYNLRNNFLIVIMQVQSNLDYPEGRTLED